jgi:hypothetical protein
MCSPQLTQFQKFLATTCKVKIITSSNGEEIPEIPETKEYFPFKKDEGIVFQTVDTWKALVPMKLYNELCDIRFQTVTGETINPWP